MKVYWSARQNGRAGSTTGFSSAVRGAGRPSWINHRFSLAVRRAGPTTDSARLFAELDQSSSENGRAGPVQFGEWPSWTSPVRRTAELDQPLIQFGERPSWINHRFSSAVHRAGPAQYGERPS
ncbi:hypothetical protein DY000_02006618 [Brassica cretica]|uniref:Uncharacterized protein n=1 Tax=Brassica cretica TaxID=69181 RepID=A0ABQ7CKC7_BRACR|nr:hypothetical protein DY000_02006618 [Brassica cretica]